MSIVLQSSGGGSVTLQEAVTASNLTITVPAATATMAINGPAFSVWSSINQSPLTSATATKVQLNNEEFDTANCFDSTTNYRFTPNVAGYYQVNGAVVMTGSSVTRLFCSVYKNGSEYKRGSDLTVTGYQPTVSTLVYLNGSTDYIELYCWINGTGLATSSSEREIWFNGAMVRAA
jgi:hypothetical protein